MCEYQSRIVDAELLRLVSEQPAVVLQGAKGVGKTASASRVAATVLKLEREPTLEIVRADPESIATRAKPVLIDEWQLHWPIWNTVRQMVDEGAPPGSYLLTGSMAPRNANIHSGAGRMVGLRLRPMSLAERRIETPAVSLTGLLDGTAKPEGSTAVNLENYVAEIVGSGFPGIRALPEGSRPDRIHGYVEAIVNKSFPEYGFAVRRPDTLRRWLSAYAWATATTATYSALLDVATPGEANKPAKATTSSYRDALNAMWLLDEIPAWNPNEGIQTRLSTTPKHFLADPALAVDLTGLTAEDLLGGVNLAPDFGPITGRLFEALACQSLLTYAQAARATVSYLRTQKGDHEIDFIIERRRRIVPIEVKLSQSITDADTKHLHWLKEQLGDRVADMAIITTGTDAYRRADGIAVIPLALLGS
jgi:predicted AAA+ superfamily ATPase